MCGMGIINSICRLKMIYGDDFNFSIFINETGGTTVRLEGPFQKTDGGYGMICWPSNRRIIMKLDFNQEMVYPTPEPEEWNQPRTYEIVNCRMIII